MCCLTHNWVCFCVCFIFNAVVMGVIKKKRFAACDCCKKRKLKRVVDRICEPEKVWWHALWQTQSITIKLPHKQADL